MDGKSKNIIADQQEKLKELFPEVFTEDKVDFDKLKSVLGAEVDLGERYGLSWKGKSNVFRAIQEPTTKTLRPHRDESVNFDETNNLFIEGDNLEVLKCLQRSYYGKVKMIYIDPPYNTGNDFVYNDKFAQSQDEYAQEAGIKNEDGRILRTDGLRKNSKDGGHFHSNWLNMMYPRLYLARNLLQQDGVIFVSIDDNEVHNLRMIMDEIFGEENFVAQLVWNSATGGGIRSKFVNYSHQYILCYGRSLNSTESFWAPLSTEAISQYKSKDKNGLYREKDFAWRNASLGKNQKYYVECPDGEMVKPKDGYIYRFIESRFAESLSKNEVVFKKTKTSPLVNQKGEQASWNIYIKKYLGSAKGAPVSVLPKSLVGMNDSGTKEMMDLFGVALFDNPKSVRLLSYLLEFGCNSDGIVLDFFAGSGTTAHAVNALNAQDGGSRKWICVQLPEETGEKSEARKAGYEYISDITKERIKRASKRVEEDNVELLASRKVPIDLGFEVLRLAATNFKAWDGDIDDAESMQRQIQLHLDPLNENVLEEDLLLEIMLKQGVQPTTKYDKIGKYWKIYDNELIICLAETVSEELFYEILKERPRKLVVLDNALQDDQARTNLSLQANKNNVDLQVI